MSIRQLCNRDVICATRDTSIADAAAMMRQHHVGNLVVAYPVDDRQTPVGIVTDRDIVVEVVAASLDPSSLCLGDLLVGHSPIQVDENVSQDDAIRRMVDAGVRRLAVVDLT